MKLEEVKFHPYLAIDHMYGGGAERAALDLVNNWPKKEQPVLLLLSAKGTYFDQIAEHAIVLEVGDSNGYVNKLRAARKLLGFFERYPPKFIVSFLPGMNKFLLRYRALGIISCPVAVNEQNNFYKNRPHKYVSISAFLSYLETKFLYKYVAFKVIAVSKGVADSLKQALRLNDRRVTTILNPIDLDKISAHSEHEQPQDGLNLHEVFSQLERPVFLAVGRLAEQKNYPLMLNAFRDYSENNKGTLLILGEGQERPMLEGLIVELELKNVLMPGFSGNPWWYMKRADVFILSSSWEGYGMVLVESLACGTGFISTDCPYGPREIFETYGFGLLTETGNREALVDAMVACSDTTFDVPTNLLSDRAPDCVISEYRACLK